MKKYFLIFLVSAYAFSCQSYRDVKRSCNYDESKVKPYVLPDPLICLDGTVVTSARLWWAKRRPELLSLFQTHVYGKTPRREHDTVIFSVHKVKKVLNGKALMKEIDVFFTPRCDTHSMRMLLFVPVGKTKVPCFVGLNFYGNICVMADTSVSMTDRWMRKEHESIVNHRATEKTRGIHASRWPVEKIIDRGYAVATAYYGDLDPDYDDGFVNGIHPLFYRKGQTRPDSAEWGAIGAWAWGMSRMVDYLQTDSCIDTTALIAIGHSRLGKTALWAGAQDLRFDMVISNNSGCGGAALSKRQFGENVLIINTYFPHWFCANFKKYNQHEEALPVDQHELIALIAPRPVYVASASKDLWADPKGEFLSVVYASPVYRLLGKQEFPLKEDQMPPVNAPVFSALGYHLREGEHDITVYDWEQYLNFADYHFRK